MNAQPIFQHFTVLFLFFAIPERHCAHRADGFPRISLDRKYIAKCPGTKRRTIFLQKLSCESEGRTALDCKTPNQKGFASTGEVDADGGSGRGSDSVLPPLACADCRLGRFAIYGPTKAASPNEIYIHRRGMLAIQAGRTFLREGEKPSQSYTLYSGWAFGYKQLADGRRQILSFLLPGDWVVLENLYFPNLPLPYSVKTLTAIAVCTFALGDMVRLANTHGAQSQRLSNTMYEHMASLNQRLIDIGRKSAMGRLAQLILDLEMRLRHRGLSVNGEIEFPAKQEHLGDALGLTTVYVNRTLDRLRKLDLIDFKRNWMVIKDFETLSRIAENE